MQVQINGKTAEINDTQAEIIRTDVQTINGRPFVSLDIVTLLCVTEGQNSLAAGNIEGMLTSVRVGQAIEQFVALADQV